MFRKRRNSAGIGASHAAATEVCMHRAAPIVLFSLLTLVTGCSGTRPTTLGVQAGALSPCPPSPNCVSSSATDEEHGIAPLSYDGHERAEVRELLLAILAETSRVNIVVSDADYIHAEFTTLIWRFVDDVEFYLPEGEVVVHVRSASRLGESDLGKNRERIEELRAAFDSRLSTP